MPPKLRSLGASGTASSAAQAGVIPVGQTTVLSQSELNRLRNVIREGDLKASGILPQSERDMDRERLRHASLNRVAGWGNTLEAARGAKEQKAREAAEAYELMRQRQDDAEELFKAESRKVAIERARSLLFSQNEQVKCLESKYEFLFSHLVFV
jgi:hypothetical protein